MNKFSDMITIDPTKMGEMKDLKRPDMPLTDTVHVHLRPGKTIQFQENSDRAYKTTGEILATNTVMLIANRDGQGYSQGNVFLDHGETLSELNDKTYEYYNILVSGGSIKKQVLNE